jgi:hypothetical protein
MKFSFQSDLTFFGKIHLIIAIIFWSPWIVYQMIKNWRYL